jgi:tape measure domain-containing protein
MAGEATVVGARITADPSQFTAGVRTARAEFQGFQREIGAGARDAAKSLDGLVRGLQGAAGLFAISQVAGYARGLADVADQANAVRSSLELSSGSAAAAASAYAQLFRVAQESRVSFTDLAGTFAQMSRATGDLGISQERLVGISRTVSQAVTISGGSAQSAQAALVQLSQGFAAGTLRGEELNSVMEQTPRLAQAIAQGMGVSIGQLRQLGQDGKLTAEAVLGALERAGPGVAAEFGKIAPTIGQAFTALGNSGTNLVGTLDRITGASGGAARGILSISNAVDTLARDLTSNTRVQQALDILGKLAGGVINGNPFAQAGRILSGDFVGALNNSPIGGFVNSFSRPRAEPSLGDLLRNQGLPDLGAGPGGSGIASRVSAYVNDKSRLTRPQQRDADLAEARGKFDAIAGTIRANRIDGGLGGDRNDAQYIAAEKAFQQEVATIREKYAKDGAADAKAAATDSLQAQRTSISERVAAIRDGAKAEQDTVASEGRQGLRTEESVIRERGRLQLDALGQQRVAAQELIRLSGADLSEKAKAAAEIAKLDRERTAAERQMTNELAELAARRSKAITDETIARARAAAQPAVDARARGVELTKDLEAQTRAIRERVSVDEARLQVEIDLAAVQVERIRATEGVDQGEVSAAEARVAALREQLTLTRQVANAKQVGERRQQEAVEAANNVDQLRGRKSDIDALTSAIEGFGRSSAKAFADYAVDGTASFATVRRAFVKELFEMAAYRGIRSLGATASDAFLSAAGIRSDGTPAAPIENRGSGGDLLSGALDLVGLLGKSAPSTRSAGPTIVVNQSNTFSRDTTSADAAVLSARTKKDTIAAWAELKARGAVE